MKAQSAAAELGSWVRVRVWAVGRETQPPRLLLWERDGGTEGGVGEKDSRPPSHCLVAGYDALYFLEGETLVLVSVCVSEALQPNSS